MRTRSSKFFVLAVGAVVAALVACSSSHSVPEADGSMLPPDASVGGMCGAGPSWFCVSGTPGGTCGDAGLMPTCVGDTWTCPSGTIRSDLCRCVGRSPGPSCTCGASGWVCSDAGVGPVVCDPSNPDSVVGMPCLPSSGPCGAACPGGPCSMCSYVECSAGTWRRVEVFPGPMCDLSFDCGTGGLRCMFRTAYCRVVLDDTGGPDTYSCEPLPAACGEPPGCMTCFGTPPGFGCTEDGGAVTVTVGGG